MHNQEWQLCHPQAAQNEKKKKVIINHFTVSCLVAPPLNESEVGGDLVLIETSLLFSC